MEINNIYDKGLIISKTAEFGLESFEQGTNIIKDLCNSQSLILVIDDKSIESTLALVSTIRARINLILLDVLNFERQYENIIKKFKPDLILSSNKTFSKLGFDNYLKTSLFNCLILKKTNKTQLSKDQFSPIVLLGTSGTSDLKNMLV